MKRREIILFAVPTAIALMGLFFAWQASQPNPSLEITKTSNIWESKEIDFYLSNDQTGIALVKKIELDVKKFEIVEGCSDRGPSFLRLGKFMSEYINIEPNPKIYTIENLFDFDRVEWFPTSDGLKYGGGDIDQFTIPYIIPKNSLNATHGYSFDVIIRAEWCNSSLCIDKKIVESPILNVGRLGICPFENELIGNP